MAAYGGRMRLIVAGVAVAVTVFAGSSDPDGWGGGASIVVPAVHVAVPAAERRPAGRRWAGARTDIRRWTASFEPHGRRWHSG
ncbi:MAG TPA: hypothetical protein VEG29_05155 [Candidatus Binatia bacterium]|nr:hypothetical protein [Candidatus Binatia bacterium]